MEYSQGTDGNTGAATGAPNGINSNRWHGSLLVPYGNGSIPLFDVEGQGLISQMKSVWLLWYIEKTITTQVEYCYA
jgi:hypothetical protein